MPTHRLPIFATALFLISPFASAQFYNEARDKKAQEAEAAARQIASGALFEKETKNIDALSRLQIQGQLDLGRVDWISALDSFTTWADVKAKLSGVKQKLGVSALPTEDERKARLAEIKDQQNELKKALGALQRSETKDPAIIAILDNLDKGEAVLKFAEKLVDTNNKDTLSAFDDIAKALSVAKSLYASWKAARDATTAAEAAVAALAVPREQLELNMLAIEVNQLNQLGIIAARRALEAEEVLKLIKEAEGNLVTAGVSGSSSNIETTIRAEKDRDKLFFQLQALHIAVSVSARNTLPNLLAELRSSQEEWRGSVCENSTVAKNYEQIVLAAAQRLALYYKGGIKPGQIAQLLYNLSGLVSLPILAAK